MTPSLTLPRFSPGKALQDSMHEAMKGGGTEAETLEARPAVLRRVWAAVAEEEGKGIWAARWKC